MNFNTEDELWAHIETTYDEKTGERFLHMVNYYEIKYCNNYVYEADREKYEKAKRKDTTGELDILALQYFELIKPQLDKNLGRK